MPEREYIAKTGFIFQRAYCTQCRFAISRRHLIHKPIDGLMQPRALKEDIIARVRQLHNKNCEPGIVIVYDTCYYEQ